SGAVKSVLSPYGNCDKFCPGCVPFSIFFCYPGFIPEITEKPKKET
ncbi:unnamed protein product, partial [marine sediment metagenome]